MERNGASVWNVGGSSALLGGIYGWSRFNL